MTRTRIHNLSMSLDGFGTGEGLSADAPFGHAGHRLHEWMIATRFGAGIMGGTGGTVGVDDAVAQQHEPGIGAEIMGAGKFGRRAGRTTPTGQGGGARTCRSTRRPSCSPIGRGRRSRWPAGRRSTSSTPRRPRPSTSRARRQPARTCASAAARPSPATSSAGLVDHIHLVQVPIVLGRGVRLWDGLEALEADYDIEAVSTPGGVTHLTFTRS